jgi:hypothetical protein
MLPSPLLKLFNSIHSAGSPASNFICLTYLGRVISVTDW